MTTSTPNPQPNLNRSVIESDFSQKTSKSGLVSLENIGYLLIVLGSLLTTVGFLVPVFPLAYLGLAISFLGLLLCFVVLAVTLISCCISKSS